MQSFLAMVVANLRMTVRNRTATFWNLAFPAIFIVIFGAIFNNGTSTDNISVGVIGPNGDIQQGFIQALDNTDGFSYSTGSLDEELTSLEEGDVDIVVAFAESGQGIDYYYSDAGGPTAQISRVAVRCVLNDVLGASTGSAVNEREVASDDTTYIDWFIPGILAMSLMNTGVIGISTAFVAYRERGIFRRIKVTPFALWKFLLARIVSGVVVSLTTSAILVGVGALIWGARPQGNLLLIALVLVIGSLTFVSIGYAIAAIARTTETAASYSNLVTFPMLFLSGVFFPVASMPDWLAPLVRIMPLNYMVNALRDPMLYGRGIGAVLPNLLFLIAIFTAAMLFSVRFFRWDSTDR
ncbi:MAG: ABC transporter permease [Thermomicrobiales bacterium]